MYLNASERIWTSLNKSEQVQTSSNKSKQVQIIEMGPNGSKYVQKLKKHSK